MGFYQEPDGSLSKTATPQSTWRGDIKDDMTYGYDNATPSHTPAPSYTPTPHSPYIAPTANRQYYAGSKNGSNSGKIFGYFVGLCILGYVLCNWQAMLDFIGVQTARAYAQPGVLFNQLFSRGAAILGIWLSIQYFACLIRGLHRMPWSVILGAAWLCFVCAFVLVLGVDPKFWFSTKLLHTDSHTEAMSTWFANFSFGFCWIAAILFWVNKRYRQAMS